ncbi:MAG: ATPase [Bacteroidetes bacterium]|jgi:DNA replication protein DnaC|nr:ATPase [Bacteroidota bacterium]
MTQTNQLLKPAMDAYSEIELTEAEREQVLLAARQRKYAEQKRKEYAAKMNQAPQYPIFTSDKLFENFETLTKTQGFVLDPYNKEIIQNLCHYFTHDKRCTLDLNKGLMVMGPVGCGKTTIMNMFRLNQTNSYAVISSRVISYDYAEKGHQSIARYNSLIPTSDEFKTYGQKLIGVCFDDLGTEVDKKNYGNQLNVMADILLNRYEKLWEYDENGEKVPHLAAKTHVTTNLSADQIEERYGSRVRSRLREMFNQVNFDIQSPDRRK